MQYRQLGQTGLRVSILGLGTSPLGGVFGPIDEAEGIRAVHTALDLGINFIDTAPYYGVTKSEWVLGRALKGVRRDRFVLSTKVGQYDEGQFDFSAARVTRSIEESCERLGVDYVDLLICHDIEFADARQILDETLPALARLRSAGRIGHIGISGLPLKALRQIVAGAPLGLVETVLSFCRYTLNDTALEAEIPFYAGRGTGVINASPTGMGLFTEQGPPPWHPAPPEILAGAKKAVAYCRSIGADITKLALQFAAGHPAIATTLVGSAKPAELRRNIAAIEEPTDAALLANVQEILRPIRNHNFTRGRPENRDQIVA